MLSLEVEGSPNKIREVLSAVDGVRKVTHGAGISYTVTYNSDTDIRRAVFRSLAKADCPVLMMNVGGMSLEESFLRLTQGGEDQ